MPQANDIYRSGRQPATQLAASRGDCLRSRPSPARITTSRPESALSLAHHLVLTIHVVVESPSICLGDRAANDAQNDP